MCLAVEYLRVYWIEYMRSFVRSFGRQLSEIEEWIDTKEILVKVWKILSLIFLLFYFYSFFSSSHIVVALPVSTYVLSLSTQLNSLMSVDNDCCFCYCWSTSAQETLILLSYFFSLSRFIFFLTLKILYKWKKKKSKRNSFYFAPSPSQTTI